MPSIVRRTKCQISRLVVFMAVAGLLVGAMVVSPLVSGQNSPPTSGGDDNRPLREPELIAQGRPLPDYDSRSLWQARLDNSKMQAARALQTKESGAMVQFDSTSGGVSQVFRQGGYLTEAQGSSPLAEMRQYIAENPALFGLSQGELSNFKSVAENRDSATGVTHVYLQQQINGLQVFASSIKGHVDAEGRLISIEGNYYPNSSYPNAGQTVSAKDALIAALQSSLPDMLAKAAPQQNPQTSGDGNILPAGPAYSFPSVLQAASGADQLTLFDKGLFASPIRVRQVIFPTADGSVLAWEVDVQAPNHQASYVMLIDANTKELLYRTNTTRSITNSKASVFTKNPDATPLSVQNFFGDAVASPSGWSSGFATIGNNVQGDSATSAGDFIYPFTDAWKTAGLNNFDLAGMRIRYTPTDALATGYTTAVSAAGSTAPGATNLLPFFTNTDDGTINLICGGGWTAKVLGATFADFWVNTDGSVSLGAGITDSFPSKVSFSNDTRRIAGLWRDLNPGGGGTLTGDCAPEGGGQRIRVVWNAVPNFPAGGSHTFAITVHGIGTGLDNIIDVDYGAISSLTGELVGVGGNSGTPFAPATTGVVNYRDLSVAQSPGIAGGLAQTFPDQDLNLSITNLAYQANLMHDFFYGLGFTEAAGNYQLSNLDRGGAPADPVQSEAQYGLGIFNNNDFFVPAPDGSPAMMATGLFSIGACRRDSAFDASAIRHEYTHGVTTRMVGGPANVSTLSSFQGGALGEGWSDAGAFNSLNDPVIGAYSTCNPAGIRSAPYNANPSTYADFGNKSATPASGTPAGIGVVFQPEVHRDGEIWASALWEIHVALGEPTASKLLFEGLRYTPQEPSMVDAKNAVLIADQVTFNGAHLNTLYSIFAARGLGASAAAQQGSFDAQPFFNGWTSTVFAAFDTPSNPYGGVKSTVFADDFEGSGPGWTVAGTDGTGGGTGPTLWHISARKTSSGTKAFYYGREGAGDYNTGFRNFGSLISPQIQLPAINSTQPAITLEWDQFRQTGDSFFFDGGFVRIKDVNAGTTTQVSFTQNTRTSFGNTAFEHQKINLNAFAGKLIQVEFFMDTFDSIANAAEGWYIDNVKVNALASAPALSFSSPVYTVNETAGTVTITVNRTGDTTPIVAVNYATSNGTATAGADYGNTSGTLTFNSGDITKTFTIPIVDDTLAEGPETVNLALSNPTGSATLGAQNTAALIIFDSEVPSPPNAYAVTTTNSLLLFNTFAPQLIISTTPITGLQGGENVLAIDFRPANGQLYALGSTNRLYTINTSSGVATQVGAAGSFTLTGTDFGADFNPVVDRLRAVSDARQNIRINPNDGTLSATDTNLIYTSGDPNFGASANVVAAAYTNNFAGAETTTLYDIDSNVDSLVRQGGVDGAPSPNSGQLTTIGSLGVNTTGLAGLDIRAGDNTAYASLTAPADVVSKLYTINLSTGAATLIAPIGGSALIRDIALAPGGSFQFSASTASVSEGAGKITITVNRSGDTTGSTTVNVNTADGTALQKSDYTIRRATLTFGPGEVSKTVDIFIVDDVFIEGPETFTISLSNPSGDFSLDGTSAITVTITDNDSNPAAPNPLDSAGFFVRQQYLDFLNREPDTSGLNFWTNEITSCGVDASCITGKRVNVSAAFFLSIEFQETGGYAIRMQRTAFGKNSQNSSTRVTYQQFMTDAQLLGDGVVIGQVGADARLAANKNIYANQMVISPAFIALYPTALAADPYVTALFASASVTPTAAEKAAAITAFGAGGTNGRVAALRSVADSASVRQAEFTPSFVLMQYYGYLRRNPTDAPDSNDNGYQFWLTKLNSFGGDFQKAEMVKAFISSLEYRQRFGP